MTSKPDNIPTEKILAEKGEEVLVCRDLSHSWRWVTDMEPTTRKVGNRRIRTVVRTIICTRCETQRTDEYRLPTFEKLRTVYTYPEGYLAKRHGTHLRVAEIRAEIYRRIKKGAW